LDENSPRFDNLQPTQQAGLHSKKSEEPAKRLEGDSPKENHHQLQITSLSQLKKLK